MTSTCRKGVLLCALAMVATVGCVTTAHYSAEVLQRYDRDTQIVLIPVDVQLFELTAGGLPEPRADWTESARANLNAAIAGKMADLGFHVVAYDAPEAESEEAHQHDQLFKLHAAVSRSLQAHEYSEGGLLPTKTSFDWTLGDAAVPLGRAHDAEYALFVWLRDSYASAGRQAVMVLSAALVGAVPAGGQQVGAASLVNLRTGAIVWFNRLIRGTGNVRNAAGAAETVEELLAGFPR